MRVLDGKCLAINMLRSNQLILREYVKKACWERFPDSRNLAVSEKTVPL